MLGNRLNAFGQVLHDVVGYDAMQQVVGRATAPVAQESVTRAPTTIFSPWCKSARSHPREIRP